MIGRLHTFFVVTESVEGGIVSANVVDVAFWGDAVLHFQRPIAGVDEEAAKPLAKQVHGGAHSSAEDAVGVARLAGVCPSPCKGHEGCFQFDWISGFHTGQRGSVEKDLRRGFEVADAVNV